MDEKEIKKFYNSKEWKQKREDILKRDNYECQDCIDRLKKAKLKGITLIGRDRLIRRAEQVHHIEELKVRPDLKLDNDNLTSLCNICHNLRHDRYVYGFLKKNKKKYASEEKW